MLRHSFGTSPPCQSRSKACCIPSCFFFFFDILISSCCAYDLIVLADPILAYNAENEINQLQWSMAQPDWIAIAFAQKLQILRV